MKYFRFWWKALPACAPGPSAYQMEKLMSHTATQTTIGAAVDAPQRAVENSPSVPVTTYRTVSVDGLKVFYREAGNAKSPVVLLLHGFPTSSHIYRHLFPSLSPSFHLSAPHL